MWNLGWVGFDSRHIYCAGIGNGSYIQGDCGAVEFIYTMHNYTSSLEEAAGLALNAGPTRHNFEECLLTLAFVLSVSLSVSLSLSLPVTVACNVMQRAVLVSLQCAPRYCRTRPVSGCRAYCIRNTGLPSDVAEWLRVCTTNFGSTRLLRETNANYVSFSFQLLL